MAEEKKMTLTELNSKIKEQAENPTAQKALLILKGGLKAYEGTEYTEKQVKELVEVRAAAEKAAAETAANLNNDELFEYCSNLETALEGSVDICFAETTEEEETVEESEESSEEESEETAEEETEEEEQETKE